MVVRKFFRAVCHDILEFSVGLPVMTLDEAAAPRVGMTDLFGYNVRSDPVAGKHLARVIG